MKTGLAALAAVRSDKGKGPHRTDGIREARTADARVSVSVEAGILVSRHLMSKIAASGGYTDGSIVGICSGQHRRIKRVSSYDVAISFKEYRRVYGVRVSFVNSCEV